MNRNNYDVKQWKISEQELKGGRLIAGYMGIVMMLLGSTNFFVHLLLIRGRFKAVFFHCETRLTIFLLALFVPVLAALLFMGMYGGISESFRIALFQAVSALTTAGFQTVDSFADWTPPMIFLMIVLMLIGGGTGSTAGGLKIYRVYVMLKEIWWNLAQSIYPNRVVFTEQINRGGKIPCLNLHRR